MTKIYRSRDDKVVFGVCGGLAKYFAVDSTILRLIFVVATLYQGLGILLYIILAVIMPEEKVPEKPERPERSESGEVEVDDVEGDVEGVVDRSGEMAPKEERRRVFALGLIVIGSYFLLKDFISIYISSSQILGIILLLLGAALLLKKG
jgi:phage shock protein PspC (stress-responsive transcriptional regulator)